MWIWWCTYRLYAVWLTGRLLVVFVRLAHHQFVLAEPERIAEDGDGVKVDVGVRTLRLARARTVEVPNGKICWKKPPYIQQVNSSTKDACKQFNNYRPIYLGDVDSLHKYNTACSFQARRELWLRLQDWIWRLLLSTAMDRTRRLWAN